MHYSVMLPECLEYLAVKPDGIYVDATAGLGGHSGAIARKLDTGFVVACDRDGESLEMAKANTADCGERIRFVQTRFSGLRAALDGERIGQVDGLLADLGVSRYQLTTAERGFSFMNSGPADMRMDRSEETTAADLVNFSAEKALADLIFQLGEERRARSIARALVRARPIRDTSHLASVVESVVHRTGPTHPATRTFMALRIAVNREGEELKSLMAQVPDLVKPGGRFVVLTFMSTEDRVCKERFRELQREGLGKILTKHVVPPSETEVRENPPSRSAKLRAIEILG